MGKLRDLGRAIGGVPPKALARGMGRYPLEAQAAQLINGLPVMELVELTGPATVSTSIAPKDSRHAWSLGAAEQFVLQTIVASRNVRTAFEIGTFNGGTTRVIAEALPADGRVITLDLPPDEFDASQRPDGFTGHEVGIAYRSSARSSSVEQLLGDSLRFDPTPYEGTCDLVLVDGGHEYVHGVADTLTALRLVAPGGVILWDDFTPYWHGLVRGITEAMADHRLARIPGTSLGVHVAPGLPGAG